jgi:phage terminase large subunit-like protein
MDVTEMSLAQKVSLLSPAARDEMLDGLDLEALQWDWSFWARPSQYIPMTVTQSRILFLGGRGAGKTRGGCEWTREKSKALPGSRGLLVARTAADVRDVLVNGESGILNIHPPSEMPVWEPSKRLLTWPNGTTALVYSAEIPDALRGIQSHWSLADEIGTWESTPDSSGLTAWDNLVLATRLGEHPQVLAMTTPRRTKVIRDLLAQADEDPDRVLVRRSRTADNRGNLSMAYLDAVVAIYEGTSLAAQELDGQMLDDVEGALWSMEQLDLTRLMALPSDLFKPYVVIGVDPSVAENPRDEAGIVVVVGTSHPRYADRHVYVMEDASLHGSPDEWASRVATVARKWGAPVVAETNQGGALIKNALLGVDPTIRVVGVHARVGKALRAEPVQMASQQGRLHMVGEHGLLEDQLTSWQPEVSKKSPDRLDAMVYACLAVLTEDSKKVGNSPLRITSRARARATSRLGARTPAGVVARGSRGEDLRELPPHMRRVISRSDAPWKT